jgi:hypothetical protein
MSWRKTAKEQIAPGMRESVGRGGLLSRREAGGACAAHGTAVAGHVGGGAGTICQRSEAVRRFGPACDVIERKASQQRHRASVGRHCSASGDDAPLRASSPATAASNASSSLLQAINP